MTVNPWTNGLCLKCKSPLIVIDETHMCTSCQEEIRKIIYDLKHRKTPKPNVGSPRKVMVIKPQ
jgi:transcription initiation factor IIE alpha subunit